MNGITDVFLFKMLNVCVSICFGLGTWFGYYMYLKVLVKVCEILWENENENVAEHSPAYAKMLSCNILWYVGVSFLRK